MKKYRIVEENGKFYPEQRYWVFFWGRLQVRIGGIPPCYVYSDIVYDSLEEAEDHIRQIILKEKFVESVKNKIKIHSFNENSNPKSD